MSQRSRSKYGYLWVTLALFLLSIVGHWSFGWWSYVDEAKSHNQPIDVVSYLAEMSHDTLENWQSESLQLMWQVAGLSFLWYVGSSQSKEQGERLEERIDFLLARTDDGLRKQQELDQEYPRC